jgi:hypothetical protein
MLSRVSENAAFDNFISGSECPHEDRVRLTACRASISGKWLSPQQAAVSLPDDAFRIAVRLRLGLSPFPFELPACPLCRKGAGDPWHPFACPSVRRRAVTTRHDRAMRLVCEFARACSATTRLEPKDFGSLVPDAEIFFSHDTILCDFSGVHATAPSHLASGPGRAVAARAAAKHAKYDAHAAACDSRFVPLVVDCWGSIHDEFRELLKTFLEESKRSCFAPASGGLSLPDFLAAFSSQWQLDNARIVFQWQRACRMLLSRNQ